MKAIRIAAVCAFAMGPAFAGHFGYHFGGGNRLVSGSPTVGLHVVRPAGVGPRQLYLAPRPAVRTINPATGQRTVHKAAVAR